MNVGGLTERLVRLAVERAKAFDAAWFEANPARRWRMRDEIAHEHAVPVEGAPQGFTPRTVVYQAGPGLRLRVPVQMPADFTDEAATDAWLAVEFAAMADAEDQFKKATLDRMAAEVRSKRH